MCRRAPGLVVLAALLEDRRRGPITLKHAHVRYRARSALWRWRAVTMNCTRVPEHQGAGRSSQGHGIGGGYIGDVWMLELH